MLVVRGLLLDSERGVRRVLLVRGEDGLWHLPGGHADCEETAEVAVVREVRDEVGLDCAVVGLVAFRNRIDADSNLSTAAFLLEKVGGEARIADSSEITEVGFFAPEQVQELELGPLAREVALAALRGPLRVLPPAIAPHAGGLPPVTIFMGDDMRGPEA